MNKKQDFISGAFTHAVVDAAIKVAMVFVMVVWCFEIVRPFLMPILWGGIIAIALYPIVILLSKKTKLSVGKSSLIVTLLALSLLIVPSVIFSGALVSGTTEFVTEMKEGAFAIPPPKDSVAEMPIIGKQLYESWLHLSSDLENVLKENKEYIADFSASAAATIGSLGLTVLQFIISIIIAGVFMKNADGSSQMFYKIAVRLAGSHGNEFASLSVATVRSVVQGVIGVAFIQCILSGVGMWLVGVPGTGIWMLLVLILAIVQLPALIVLGPVIAYVYTVESSTIATIFMIWSLLVATSDTLLKPILMGRGVDIPMLVILLGAIGGMLMSGIVGLFVGAVVLALSYKLFSAWLVIEINNDELPAEETENRLETTAEVK